MRQQLLEKDKEKEGEGVGEEVVEEAPAEEEVVRVLGVSTEVQTELGAADMEVMDGLADPLALQVGLYPPHTSHLHPNSLLHTLHLTFSSPPPSPSTPPSLSSSPAPSPSLSPSPHLTPHT